MTDKTIPAARKTISADWLVRGVLTRIGETFDRLTGRNWKPSSSLATSELIEKVKTLLDAEARDIGGGRKFVPHNIKLKMQWDKFSTDAESATKTLENELLVAAVDHINDQRYYTYAPLKLEIKSDYFTEGIKLSAGFGDFGEAKEESEAAINVSVPDLKNVVLNQTPEVLGEPEREVFNASFTIKDKPRTVELAFAERQRLSVGRTKENDLWLDDASVSKIHAALILNSQKQLIVSDTGSTNGTFINGERIAYGRAFAVKADDKLKFGMVEVALEHLAGEVAANADESVEAASESADSTTESGVLKSNSSEKIRPTRQKIILKAEK